MKVKSASGNVEQSKAKPAEKPEKTTAKPKNQEKSASQSDKSEVSSEAAAKPGHDNKESPLLKGFSENFSPSQSAKGGKAEREVIKAQGASAGDGEQGAARNEPAGTPATQGSTNTKADPAATPKNQELASRVGVTLNDAPQNLPDVKELQELGATGARITLREDNFRPDDPKKVEDPNDPTNPEKARTNLEWWESRLQSYKDANIEVTLNLPSELANGWKAAPNVNPMDPPQTNPDGSQRGSVSDTQPEEWNKWFKGDPSAARPEDRKGWLQNQWQPQVEKAVDKLGKYADSYEVWNEPDEPANRWWTEKDGSRAEYKPGLPAADYGHMLRDTYNTVQQKDPGARVVTAGLDSGSPDYLNRAAAATPDASGKPTLYADDIGLHPYAQMPDDPPSPDSTSNFESIIGRYQGRDPNHEIRFQTPTGRPPELYLTETSPGAVNETDMARYARNTAGELDTPGLHRAYYFWQKSYDHHPGLKRSAAEMEQLRAEDPNASPYSEAFHTLRNLIWGS